MLCVYALSSLITFGFVLITASCPDPGIPVNGERVDGSFEHGKHLQFKCKPGFWLVGSQLIFCNEGTWSNEIPTCRGMKLKNFTLKVKGPLRL